MIDIDFPPAKEYGFWARVLRVIDGDTLELGVDLAFNVSLSIVVRMADINAPERGTPEGEACMNRLQKLLGPPEIWDTRDKWVRTIQRKTPGKLKTDKYQRYVAYVCRDVPGSGWQCLNQVLLEEGLATPYTE